MHLSWIDIAIVLTYLGGTVVAGFVARSAVKDISDFLVAGRSLKTHMAVATMVSTGLGLVTAMLDNAGFQVTTLDFLPSQFERGHIEHIQSDLRDVTAAQISGHDAIICCETLEHFHWDEVDEFLRRFLAAGPNYLLISVPYMGLQLDWRLYLNALTWRSAFSLKKFKSLARFRPDEEADPLCHKWEVGYRGTGLKALEDKLRDNGWRIERREFTSPTRSVFFLLTPA